LNCFEVQPTLTQNFEKPTAFQFCYRAVANGWLGDLFEVHSVMSKKVSDSTRKYLSRYAGGSMFEIGCHVIDTMVRVLGPPSKVTAHGRKTHPKKDPLQDNQSFNTCIT
jgi:predicted dehydrogenase